MLCKRPYVQGTLAYSCGQCMPCRIRKRREWTHRIMLEAAQYEDNAFVTLTYDNDHLPNGGSLVPRDVQLWLKRLRVNWPARLRYYLVGEYGDDSWRPHYHVALFNYAPCVRGRTKRDVRNRVDWRGCCSSCGLVGNAWGKGDIDVGILETASAGYLAGYVTKKMTRTDDPRLNGRWPEFARMSLRPGIGFDAMHEVASQLMRYDLDVKLVDVPNVLDHGKKHLPLGRYLRGNLRVMVGKDKNAPEEALQKYSAEMLELLQAGVADKESPSLRSQIIKRYGGRAASVENRYRIFSKRGSL